MHETWYLLLIVAVAVVALFLLIVRVRLDPFITLTIVSIAVGLAAGIPLLDHGRTPGIITVMTTGLGAALSKIAALIALGAILSEVLRSSGASRVLGERILNAVGPRHGPLAMTLCGLVVGVTIFFDPAVILLAPMAISVSKESRRSILFFAIPMATAVLAMHATLPPHPGPVALAGVLGVNYGLLFLFGPICVLPAVAVTFFYTQWAARRLPVVITEFGGVAEATPGPALAGAGPAGGAGSPPNNPTLAGRRPTVGAGGPSPASTGPAPSAPAPEAGQPRRPGLARTHLPAPAHRSDPASDADEQASPDWLPGLGG